MQLSQPGNKCHNHRNHRWNAVCNEIHNFLREVVESLYYPVPHMALYKNPDTILRQVPDYVLINVKVVGFDIASP